jgi:hypothetical protein
MSEVIGSLGFELRQQHFQKVTFLDFASQRREWAEPRRLLTTQARQEFRSSGIGKLSQFSLSWRQRVVIRASPRERLGTVVGLPSEITPS